MPARLGRARPCDAGAVQDLTAATTAVGLLRWATEDDGALTFGASAPNRELTARLARLGQWLRENFGAQSRKGPLRRRSPGLGTQRRRKC